MEERKPRLVMMSVALPFNLIDRLNRIASENEIPRSSILRALVTNTIIIHTQKHQYSFIPPPEYFILRTIYLCEYSRGSTKDGPKMRAVTFWVEEEIDKYFRNLCSVTAITINGSIVAPAVPSILMRSMCRLLVKLYGRYDLYEAIDRVCLACDYFFHEHRPWWRQ